MKKIAITGVSGFIGGHVVPHLLSSGHEVTAIVRSTEAARKAQSYGASPKICNMNDMDSLIKAIRGNDAVVHMAARLDFFGPFRNFYEDNFLLTKQVLRASKASGAKLFVYIGAAAVAIGSESSFPLNESSPLINRPAGAYGTTKAMAEKFVLSENSSEMRCIALRPPLVWADDAPVFDSISESVQKGQFLWIGGGRYSVATIHVKNLTAAIQAALSAKDAAGTFFVSDGDIIEFRKLVETALLARGIKPPSLSLPRWIARVGAWLTEKSWHLLRLSGRPPISNTLIDLIGGEFRIDDTRARHVLGYKNRISVTEGLAAFK